MHKFPGQKTIRKALWAAWAGWSTVGAWAAAPNSAEIVSIVGKAETRPAASAPWTPAKAQQVLQGGSFVRTLDESSVALLFSDKTQLRLSRNSMFEVKGVGDGKAVDTTVSLLKGKSWMQSKSVPNKLKVETPSGTAGIHGTDWVLEVDEQGATTLTVLSGEVEFGNAQGSVRVLANEQSVTQPGQAPQKRLLQNSRERVQWVTSQRVDLERYPDLLSDVRYAPIREALQSGQPGQARRTLDTLLEQDAPAAHRPSAWLLACDFALSIGEMPLARQRLQTALQRFSADARLLAYEVRVSLLEGDFARARQQSAALPAAARDTVEVLLVQGELARLDGQGARAIETYERATRLAPKDHRAWLGLGTTYAEQEHFTRARAALNQAVVLGAEHAAPALAELGAMETRAYRLDSATHAIDQSLTLAPDDYVAWTGRGVVLLARGQTDEALDAFLKAGVLEPRYARAQVYAAVAWYQMGRSDAALAALEKAKLADPNDPLPYFYEAQIQRDALAPMAAVQASREAMARFGNLKSLGPIATDRQGNASLGAAYALYGLESWARQVAVQTQHPFFAGSYLFTAERMTDPFVKNSALMQGYMTDPTLFGASPQRSTLMARPGRHIALEMGYTRSDAFAYATPSVVANGFVATPFPVAAFVQTDAPRFWSGDIDLQGHAPTWTTAFGFRPHERWGVFLYRDQFNPSLDQVALPSIGSARIHGRVIRTDLGAQWQINPQTALWLHVGRAEDDSQVASNTRTLNQWYRRQDADTAVRWTTMQQTDEWSAGLESGRLLKPAVQSGVGTVNKSEDIKRALSEGERLFVSWKRSLPQWRLQADLDYSNYRFDSAGYATVTSLATNSTRTLLRPTLSQQTATWSPSLGVAWSPAAGQTYRLVWQQSVRPAALVSLGPLDTQGIAIDTPGLQPGGKLRRVRAQGEWNWSTSALVTAFVDSRHIDNLHDNFRSLQDAVSSLAQYDRLRQQSTSALDLPESLEGVPVFAQGRISTAGLTVDAIASPSLAWTVGYVHAKTENPNLPGAVLPYFPEHSFTLGLSWFAPDRWVVRALAKHRSERSIDEGGSQWLETDWDLNLSATWQDHAKRRVFEVFARGIGRADHSGYSGVRVIWRF